MKLKLIEVDGKQYAEVQDGKPVYTGDDGSVTTYDAPAMHATIGRLNAEAKGHREAKEALEAKIGAFGDLDPEKARKALETVGNLDQKKLIDAGEVEKVKAEISSAFQKQLDQAKAEAEQLRTQHAQDRISAAFSGSKFIGEKLAIPGDMVMAAFGKNFEYKDGKIVAKDTNGNPIYSKSNPGEIASFDEALERIVETYPHRDSILKGSGQSGSGAGAPEGGGNVRTVTREQFSQLSPADQAKYAQAANKGEMKIVD
ncbi:hypothetical protein GCM10011348_45880 [Marinobacterium nitratireducens]|uniref:DUF6651 domain-containing protein n=1 Tax=Marinobacterium nitratireducens TaxID=518897 RepID=A0A917ZQR9_9GAMM|nr:DUF6651 domain-containing protein [Marinobacterium nitratireducens]GGO89046.1 hypothetical protein GCM10011348_45880 [Marinobacterium nitratireducens]